MIKHSIGQRALRAAAAGGIALSVLAPTAAFAADYPNGGDPGDPTDVAASTASNSSSSLPFTGSDAAGMAVIGAGAALAGVVMVRHSRRTRATA